MEIKISYTVSDQENSKIMHTTVDEQDIKDMLNKDFRDGILGCPMHINRHTCNVSFNIEQVIL